MGRYRPLVAALVRHTNIVQRTFSKRAPLTEGISLTAQEWQVFEYILEHQEDDSCMNCISEQLGIPLVKYLYFTVWLYYSFTFGGKTRRIKPVKRLRSRDKIHTMIR